MLSTLAFAGLTVATMGQEGLTNLSQAAAAPSFDQIHAARRLTSDPVCTTLMTSTNSNVLYECVRLNPDGEHFGKTQKQMPWIKMCSGDEALIDDLKLSITNRLFGGEGLDGKLTSRDCTAECVYSLANKDVETSCERAVSGIRCPNYMAYHWNNDDQCWESKTADWCLQEVEMPKYLALGSEAAMTWTFPAFKVKHFCAPELEEIPTQKPTSSPESELLTPGSPQTPAGCVDTDDYNCRQRYLLGFCNMPEAVSSSFKAQCPNCCADAPSEKPAPTAGESEALL